MPPWCIVLYRIMITWMQSHVYIFLNILIFKTVTFLHYFSHHSPWYSGSTSPTTFSSLAVIFHNAWCVCLAILILPTVWILNLGEIFICLMTQESPKRAPLFPFKGPVKQSLTAYSSLPFPQIVGMWRHNLNEFLTSADSNWKWEGKMVKWRRSRFLKNEIKMVEKKDAPIN